MGRLRWVILVAVAFVCLNVIAESRISEIKEDNYETNATKVLSRRKRFIVFPDGSSFQLVFCTQNHGYLQIGDIVWFGVTAALAWELPTDPKLFYLVKDHEKRLDLSQRRQDSKHITYVDEAGRVIAKVPYRRKPIINPAFAKRSVDYLETKHDRAIANTIVDRISIETMHKLHHENDYLTCIGSECNAEFHRMARKELYGKLETFFNALGLQGRQCVLRMLCESSRRKTEQGTFLEEVVRAVFTLPGGHEFELQHHRAYDEAHTATGDCSKLFPECVYRHTGEPLYG